MLSRLGPFAPLWRLSLLAAGTFVASSAMAQDADRCSGTLCDLYYGGPAPAEKAAAGQSAPTPLTVPNGGFIGRMFGGGDATPAPGGTSGTPAKRPMVAVQGGGIIGMANGATPERCSGTFCDLYYGGPPSERPAAPAAVDGTQPETAATDPVPAETPADAEPAAPVRRAPEPTCAAPATDPWRCYR